ncbi:MAG: hypothetical protein KAG92_02405 [Deltaproteobacteria bacterium]|nr:hypothetical protein [Deltaproteobacteria bacterium]
MSTKNIVDAALAKFNEKITDEVFLTIQSDTKLMREYLRAVSEDGLDAVNTSIGKAVKAAYNLDNLGECKDPQSTLIKSYTTHKSK